MSITYSSLSMQVYDSIREDILSQKYSQGDLLPTKEIAEENAISVMPVRIALQKLTDYGLVVKKERVGFYVREFSQKEVSDILGFRRMLEISSLRDYFDQLDFAQIAQIEAEMSLPNINAEQYSALDVSLHKSFIQAAHNYFLTSQYLRILDLFRLFMFIDRNTESGRKKRQSGEHSMIFQAIKNQDRERAIEALDHHLNEAYRSAMFLCSHNPTKPV